MSIHRRDFMKGIFASSALLACGFPSWALAGRRAGRCVLLLGDAAVDAAFERGVHAAFVDAGYEGPRAVRLEGRLLADAGKFLGDLEQSNELRWIAALDEASGVVFEELARSAGGRLISRGSHAHSDDGDCPLRHVWLTASADQGAAGILASRLLEGPHSFSITESFLREPAETVLPAGGSPPGFSSYRLEGGDVHLHCSGLSLPEGCRVLGRNTPEEWAAIASSGRREAPAGRSGDWVKAVGYAVAASSLGAGSVPEACSRRAFVHRAGGPAERVLEPRRFTTLVMDL